MRVVNPEVIEIMEVPGQPSVVRIQKCNPLAGRFSDTTVSCSRDTRIDLLHKPDTVVVKPANNLSTLVCRSVIHNDEFKIAKCLSKN